jgi:hypothetical protein
VLPLLVERDEIASMPTRCTARARGSGSRTG